LALRSKPFDQYYHINCGIQEPGVEFTSSNQYIQLPTFSFSTTFPNLQALLTVSFWIRLKDPASTSNGFIFRYTSDDVRSFFSSLYLIVNLAFDK